MEVLISHLALVDSIPMHRYYYNKPSIFTSPISISSVYPPRRNVSARVRLNRHSVTNVPNVSG